MRTGSRTLGSRELALLACCLAALAGGCSSQSGLASRRGQLSFEQEVSAPYDQIAIKQSLTLDALPAIQRTRGQLPPALAGTELLSRSANVIASVGQSKDGQRTWFNMIRFHENRLNVIRKYFLLVDERTGSLRAGSRRGLRFDCQMVLEEAVLSESYPSEYARQIAMLRYVRENLRRDADELGADIDAPGQNNRTLSVLTMLMNQTFEMILLKLDSSPMLTAQLSRPGGAQFDHLNFDKGTVRMAVEGDIATVEIRFGPFARTAEGDE
ncbi:MAG: hypothetical protein ABIF19_08870 [Planctomycetota bacterium]